MTLRGVLSEEEYGSVNEAVRGEYQKGEDGRYYLDVAEVDGWGFQNVTGLRTTMQTERQRREEWERKHGQLAAQLDGIDPAKIKSIPELERQIEEMKKWTPDDKVRERISELKAELENKVREANQQREQEVSARDSRIKRLVTNAKARRVLDKLKCLDSDLFLDRIERSSVIDDNDNVWPVDARGDRIQTKKKGAVGDMTLEEYCEILRDQHPRNFQGAAATGGGGDPTAAGGGGNNANNLSSLPAEERLKAIRRAGIRQ